MAGKLNGFDEAPVYERFPRFEPGSYVAEVLEITRFQSATDETKDYFKATFKVEEASPGSKTAVGDTVVEMVPLTGQHKKTFFGIAKNVIGACTGERGSDVTFEDFEEATSAENPCKGAKVKVAATPSTKKNGEPFTRTTYSSMAS